MPQILGKRRAPAFQVVVIKSRRTSPRLRGYDSKWDRASERYRRKKPFCAWCEQEGRLEYAALVDHKIPIVDGGEMFDPANWWVLCVKHHGTKAEMERAARQSGEIEKLPLWCDDPTARPARFRAP